MPLSFDELNKLYDRKRSLSYEQYFGEMELPEEEKKKRIAFSMDLELAIVFLLSSIYADYRADRVVDINFYTESIKQRYFDVLDNHNVTVDETIAEHVDDAADSIISTTTSRIPVKTQDTPEDNGVKKSTPNKEPNLWYVSKDRARYDAEEEGNTIFNHKNFVDAVKQGKTKKQWITMKDNAVRQTHRMVDDKVIGIHDFFNVGGYAMLYPRDQHTGGASYSEISGCRCTVKYIK